MVRLRSIFWALTPVLAVLLLAGCSGESGAEQAGAQEEEEEESAGPVTPSEFVGDIPQADAFFSLVAEDGEAEDMQEVRAYLCDGRQLNEWFSGSVSGEQLQLASENGVHLDTRLASEGASGTLTLSDGESFEFVAAPATGVEGFYPVNVTSSEVSGTSWGGGNLQGTRSGEEINGVITPPEGEEGDPVEFDMSAAGIEEGENRWIVLEEDGQLRIKGAKKGAKSTGFVDPVMDIRSPGFTSNESDF